MEKNDSTPTIVGLLGVAFIILKLCKVIDWSWWLVTLPFWGVVAIVLPLALINYIISVRLVKKAKNDFLNSLPKFGEFEDIGETIRKVEFKKPKSKFQERLELMEEQRLKSKENEAK